MFELEFVTDVEGNLAYFERFVSRSRLLSYAGDPELGVVCMSAGPFKLQLKENAWFVFGGDAVDKGAGDLRLVRQLVELKKQHPERVFLIVGNRDLNKLRYSAELSASDLGRPIDAIPKPHWDPNAKSLRQHLESILVSSNVELSEKALDRINTRCERLKYMFQHTLGCPDTYEHRRSELQLLLEKDRVSDEQVLASFLHDVENEDGIIRQYLENAQVAAVVGNTLFVHGAVDELNLGWVPRSDTRFELPVAKQEPAEIIQDVKEWAHAMNTFYRGGIEDYKRRPGWDEGRTTRGGEALLALQNRAAMWGRSVVSNCYADGGNISSADAETMRKSRWAQDTPLAFEGVSSDPRNSKVAEWLKASLVQRVVVGHKPSGDSPAVCSSCYTGVEIISADTSYSDVDAKDSRGIAVSVVRLQGSSTTRNQAVLYGALADSREHHCNLQTLNTDNGKCEIENDGDSFVGTLLEDGWWVKTKLLNSNTYHACKGTGRKCEYKIIPKPPL